MNNKTTIFNSCVVKAILLNNEFAISRVDELESIKSILFDFAKYNDAENQ